MLLAFVLEFDSLRNNSVTNKSHSVSRQPVFFHSVTTHIIMSDNLIIGKDQYIYIYITYIIKKDVVLYRIAPHRLTLHRIVTAIQHLKTTT